MTNAMQLHTVKVNGQNWYTGPDTENVLAWIKTAIRDGAASIEYTVDNPPNAFDATTYSTRDLRDMAALAEVNLPSLSAEAKDVLRFILGRIYIELRSRGFLRGRN